MTDETGRQDGGVEHEEGEVEWRYAIDHVTTFDTRAEAVAEAAIINRKRDERRRDVEVWAYPVCACESPIASLDHGDCCARCGGWVGGRRTTGVEATTAGGSR